jgi:hypothetical protein
MVIDTRSKVDGRTKVVSTYGVRLLFVTNTSMMYKQINRFSALQTTQNTQIHFVSNINSSCGLDATRRPLKEAR